MGRQLWAADPDRPILEGVYIYVPALEWMAPVREYALSLWFRPISGSPLYPDPNIGHLSVNRRDWLHLHSGLETIVDLRRSFRRNLWPGRSADRIAVLCPIQLFPARYSKSSSLDYFL